MTHIFIVNEQTFDIHLKYLFAGTGYTDSEGNGKTIDLLMSSQQSDSTEKTLVGMIADISRVREGDHVLFHVTGCKKIFGIFEIIGKPFFNSKQDDYLGDSLGKYLSFRIRIRPYRVYSKGITETVLLNDISTIEKPYELFWSLIYRKLTGMRGCSYITDPEFVRFESMLNLANKGLLLKNNSLRYNKKLQLIENTRNTPSYDGNLENSLNITHRLLSITKGSFEGHLQAYITQNFDTEPLKSLLVPDNFQNIWIGNEVYCSVGEQRIDILIIVETEDSISIRIIELKDEKPLASIIIEQIPWYIKWVDLYIAPNYLSLKKIIKITPTIIATPYKRNCPNKTKFYEIFQASSKESTKLKNSIQLPTELIYFEKTETDITFCKQ